MAAGRDGLSRRDRRRAEDLELAGRIGREFGLGTIDQVVRQWRGRGGLLPVGCNLTGVALGLAIGGVLLVWLRPGDRPGKEVLGVFVGGLFALAVLLIVLGERFKVMCSWYLLYSGGVAQVVSTEPEPRALRWPEVETVTIILKTDDDGDPEIDVDRCVLSGPGTEITAGQSAGFFDEIPSRLVAAAAQRNLAPRLVPPLIQAWESGEPVTAGGLSIGQDGITGPAGTRHAWSQITSMAVTYAFGPDPAPIARIDFRQAGTDRADEMFLSGIPNGIFLAHLIAHAATEHGIHVDRYRRP
jgi:hypothetical protein